MGFKFSVLWLCLSGLVFSGSPIEDIRFERVSREMGLSQHAISFIFQDSRGFLWVATREGLEKYDGYQFYKFKHEPFDPNSLSGNEISQIIEDQQGRLWMIVGSTLNRFEPKTSKFTRYPSNGGREGGLQSAPHVLYCDRSGVVWVGSSQSGLYQYDPTSDTFLSYRYSPEDDQSISSDHVSAIFQSRDGTMWIGTINEGFNRLIPETGRFKRFFQKQAGGLTFGTRNIPRNLLTPPIVEDRHGNIWVATFGSGLLCLDRKTESITQYLNDKTDPTSISSNNLWGSYADNHGNLWLLTIDTGITVLNLETREFTRFGDSDLFHISPLANLPLAEDKMGNIWIGLQNNNGLLVFERQSRKLWRYQARPKDPRSPGGNDLTFLMFDRADTLWIGTQTNGLNKYSPHLEKFGHGRLDDNAKNLLANTTVRTLLEDHQDELWLGTEDHGLLRLSSAGEISGTWSPTEGGPIASNRITALLEDAEQRIWVGTDKGLNRLDRDGTIATYQSRYNDPHRLASNKVSLLYLDQRQRVWVGTGMGGLHYIDPKRKIFKAFNLDRGEEQNSPNVITGVADMGDQYLWVSHQGVGLHRLDITDGSLVTYRPDIADPNSLSHDQVTCVIRDRNGILWVGTLVGGLNRLDPTLDRFQHFTEKTTDLPGNSIYGLIEDHTGLIWLNTESGISVFDPESYNFRNYDSRDGLLINPLEVNAFFLDDDSRFLYGGQGGYNLFQPTEAIINPHPPQIAITGFRIMDIPQEGLIEKGDVINLDYQRNHFSLDFAALDFTYPAKNQYAYKLIGFDPAWVFTHQRSVSYSNLAGGSYIFRVKASNNDGIWNEEGLSLVIEAVPPFYQARWFILLMVLLLILLVTGIFFFQRKRHQLQKQSALRQLEWRRRAEELEFARKIQLSMLPQVNLDAHPLEIQCRMRTATEVGGDYYDFFNLEDGRLCLMLGDATGHGLAAGLVVGMVKMAATVWFSGKSFSLEEMHSVLNMGLKKSLRERSMGMCLVTAILEPETGKVELASTGMPYPYHFKAADGSLTPLVMKGPPLGFFRKLHIQTSSLVLVPGDYLVLLSDGFQDRFNKNDVLWGLTALERTLTRACRFRFSSERVSGELFDACDIFADGRNNDDDMTVAVVHMKARDGMEPCSQVEEPPPTPLND